MIESARRNKIRVVSGTRLTTYCALFVCLGIVFPFVTSHAFAVKGNILLPMHIPVMLCGFVCGAKRGFLCGIITPIASSLTTQMPIIFPMAPLMAFELGAYGLVCGLLYRGTKFSIVWSLLAAMISGRLCLGIAYSVIISANFAQCVTYVTSAVVTGIPGIIIQLVFVPVTAVFLLKRLKISEK